MIILGIETSCDETSASIIEANSDDTKVKLLSNIVSTSLSLHAKTGGIIPEKAAREQIKYIIPAIKQALYQTNISFKNIDSIAITIGPGLIGSLLVGVETAKTLSYVFNKPLIPVNHLVGHIYANWLITKNQELKTINLPAIALIVSGGHTDLLYFESHKQYKWLGGTRDDAAGEAIDKIGRLLNLPYPGGPAIEKEAQTGNAKKFRFPRPMIDSNDFDFSFSGLKTAVLREIQTMKQLNKDTISNISAGIQQAIIDVLIKKTLKATRKYPVKSILLGGGVASNQKLAGDLRQTVKDQRLNLEIFVPQKSLCTDNAAMIACAAFFQGKSTSWKSITANPELYFN